MTKRILIQLDSDLHPSSKVLGGGWQAISDSASTASSISKSTGFVMMQPDPVGRPRFFIGSRAVAADAILPSAIIAGRHKMLTQAFDLISSSNG